MRIKLRNIESIIIAIAAVAAVPYASAQVTVNLTTTQQTACIATTDVNGLTLVPGTTELQATGVTLTGSGCGSNGSGGSDFGTTVTAPANASAGVPFVVTWTASSNATQCTFAGTSGAAGWPIGATACIGSECPGTHPRSVTVANGGASTFAMTCTNASGFGAAGTAIGGVSGPPTPANFPLSVPQTVTVSVPFQVSWSVQNATSCSGTASRDGSSTSLSGWTDSTSASSPRTVTATQAGNYTLQLTCSNSSGSVTSQLATTSASPAGIGCPAGLQTTLNVCRSPPVPGMPARCPSPTNVDATQYVNIWARNSGSFPGDNLATYFGNLDKTKYIAAKFTVPTTNIDPDGHFGQSSIGGSPGLTMKISQACGDFVDDGSLCFKSTTIGQNMVAWTLPTGDGNACPLVPGQSYYVNLKVTNPSSSPSGCTGNLCYGGVTNNHQ